MDFNNLTVEYINELITSKKMTNVELTNLVLDNLEKDQTNSIITITRELALAQAQALDEKGLVGYPIGIKDNINVSGVEMTAASQALKGYISVYDATLVQNLVAKNFIIVAKMNLDEFGMGSYNIHSNYGEVKNAIDPLRVAGGSSGGSTAAVASKLMPFAVGTDTGGSIRTPAAFNGVYGMRPTYGRVSRYGVIPLYAGFDQAGILSRTVKDNAFALAAMSGYDPHDSTSMDYPIDFDSLIGKDLKGMNIAIANASFDFAEGIKNNMLDVEKFLIEAGAKVTRIDIKYLKESLFAYMVLLGSEITSNLSKYDGIRFGHVTSDFSDLESLYKNTRSENFGVEVKRRLIIGMHALHEDNYEDVYVRALKIRNLVYTEINRVVNEFDLLISPTCGMIAPLIEDAKNGIEFDGYDEEFITATALASVPSISVPMGYDIKTNMPYGLLISARHFEEKIVYQAASYFESNYERKGY